jgi:hypothetical protein
VKFPAAWIESGPLCHRESKISSKILTGIFRHAKSLSACNYSFRKSAGARFLGLASGAWLLDRANYFE